MQSWSDGHLLDPRVLCIGIALGELLELLPEDDRLDLAAATIVYEAERYRPDLAELAWAWEMATEVLAEMVEECRAGALGLLVLEQLEARPF